jgi:hypothetical protein
MIVVYNSWLTRLLCLDGLVLYPFILLSTSKEETLPSTLKHELTHVNQIKRDGCRKFYSQYCAFTYRDGYQNNKYEREAYSTECIALTQTELEMLNLPSTFPKTDDEMTMMNANAR